MDRSKAMVIAQGGDPRVIDDYTVMPQAKYQIPYRAKHDGVVSKLAADDQLDYSVGIELHHKLGDQVKAGDTLLTIYSNQEKVPAVEKLLDESIAISDHYDKPQLIHEIIE